jgi:chlorite dismutase
MEWFIKKNATLPVIKVKLSQNGRSDFMKTMSVLSESEVYFSMTDVETGIPKISSVQANVLTGLTEDGQLEYFTYYQFKKNQTKKVGRYSAEFLVTNSHGNLYMPITDSVFINIIDSFAIDDVNFSSNYEIEFPCCD